MVEKRFELPVSTHDQAYEKIRLADCHKTPIFSDKSENPHARVTGMHKFLGVVFIVRKSSPASKKLETTANC